MVVLEDLLPSVTRSALSKPIHSAKFRGIRNRFFNEYRRYLAEEKPRHDADDLGLNI
jgi:hypothetical protein